MTSHSITKFFTQNRELQFPKNYRELQFPKLIWIPGWIIKYFINGGLSLVQKGSCDQNYSLPLVKTRQKKFANAIAHKILFTLSGAAVPEKSSGTAVPDIK